MRETIAITTLLLSLHIHAENYGATLSKLPVSHLQMLANNLNIMLIIRNEDLYQKNENTGLTLLKIKHFTRQHKHFIRQQKRLSIHITAEGPVKKITKKECKKMLKKFKDDIVLTDTYKELIQVSSYFSISTLESKQLTNNMPLTGTPQEDANKEHYISCSEHVIYRSCKEGTNKNHPNNSRYCPRP